MDDLSLRFERLSIVANLRMGETIIEKDCTGEGLPIYSADKSNRPWAFSTHFKRKNKRGTIVIGARGTIGFPRLPQDEAFGATQTTIVIEPNVTLYVPEYLFCFLERVDFNNLGAQQAIPMLTVDQLSEVRILRFEIPEQSKIAEVLSTVDRAIEQTEALIAKQQRIKTGLMQDLLTKGIDEHGNIRSEKTHKFKDSPVGRIPEEWAYVPIASVINKSPKSGFSPIESNVWNGAYMLGLGCLTTSGFQPRQLKYAPPLNPVCRKALLKQGDFLISRSNTRELVGLAGVYKDIGTPCIYPDLMIRLVFSNDVVAEFMEQVFMSDQMRYQVRNAAIGTSGSMVKINSRLIAGFHFPKPPIEEQKRIVMLLGRCDLSRFAIELTRDKCSLIKSGLMQDLLTGKVRVTSLLNSMEGSE